MIEWRQAHFVGILTEMTGVSPCGTNEHGFCQSERMSDDTDKGESTPSASRQQLSAIVLLAIAAVGTVVFLFIGNRPDGRVSGGAGAPPPVLRDVVGVRFGSEKAPVQVDAMLPITTGCQDAVGLFLVAAARMHGKKLSVRVFDMKSVDAQMIMARTGIKCAAVIVDGETRFDLGGTFGKVLLEGPMELSDVRNVIAGKLSAISGGVAPELPVIVSAEEATPTRPTGMPPVQGAP